jgi:hypothetical protein
MGWEVLTGVIHWWADEGLLDMGRRRFHRARGKTVRGGEALPLGSIHATRHAFAVRRTPWRLAQVSLEPADPAAPRPGWQTSADDELLPAVVAWADDATAVLKGRPVTQHVVPEFVSLDADHYEATYDGELDVLTSWTAYIDGKAAQRHTLDHLSDIPLPR